jgi:hypothetical protein
VRHELAAAEPTGVRLARRRAEIRDRRDPVVVAVRMRGHRHHPSGQREHHPGIAGAVEHGQAVGAYLAAQPA